MSKKIKLFIFIILLLLLSIGVILILSNPLLRSEKSLRKMILKKTPIGSNMDDVIKYINSKKKWKVAWISYDSGFYHQGIFPEKVIGSKSIRVNIGEYGLIFKTSVTVFWGFNEDSKLIDIWVWKTVDAI